MTKNNYPEGLDELAGEVTQRLGWALDPVEKGDMALFARALLDAMAERGYVLVDAKKHEPIGEMREGGVVWYGPNPHAFPIGTNFYAAIPGRVTLPDGWVPVPVEPTSEMLHCAEMWDDGFAGAWSRALAAAPTPPTKPQGDGSLRREAE